MSRPVLGAQFAFRDRPVEREMTPNKKLAVWRAPPLIRYTLADRIRASLRRVPVLIVIQRLPLEVLHGRSRGPTFVSAQARSLRAGARRAPSHASDGAGYGCSRSPRLDRNFARHAMGTGIRSAGQLAALHDL